MELSRRRLDSVAHYLRESGYAGKLVLVPKGKSEPFLSPDRWRLSREDALQLDRRVELHLAR
jgi:outer membrane protein OmpA-like peptidoglycan-associated protein